jgi:hypothetical protein
MDKVLKRLVRRVKLHVSYVKNKYLRVRHYHIVQIARRVVIHRLVH